jgi:hypothetical protein
LKFKEPFVSIPVLLVSTATRWIGTARIPSALAKAGFGVSLLTPRDSLAEKSRFVSRVDYLPDSATAAQWVRAFAAAVGASAPRIVLPCDDMAFRLLAMLVRTPPPEFPPALHLQLASLIRDSLGDQAHYDLSVDKTLLPPFAQTLGVRVPPYSVIGDAGAADAFAAAHGYPVVLKRAHGFAGQGVAICANRDELLLALAQFNQPDQLDLGESRPARHLIQAHVPGRVQYYLATAWKGDLLAGWASEKVVANPEPTGPPTVSRHFRSPGLARIAASLVAGLGISGHFFAEFIIADGTGEPHLLEINRRITPGSHRGRARNVDQWAALYARLQGTAPTSRTELDEGEEGLTVWFPEEMRRDPQSRYLREHPVDVPWDEPEVLEALLAMRDKA